MQHIFIKKIVFFVLLFLCFTPLIDAPKALLLGFIMTLILGNPFAQKSSIAVKWLLQLAVIGLGFGMNFYNAIEAGKTGFLLTLASLTFVLAVGWVLGKIFKLDAKTTFLVSSGTAICGGSAISAIAPVIDADQKQLSVSLGTVFILNAVALFIFPGIGDFFALTPHQFGTWCAIAIHDTSSVIGASSTYGTQALEIATTIKLGRALWIIPLSVFTALFVKTTKSKITFPYFILFFGMAMLFNTLLPQWTVFYDGMVTVSKKILLVTLFLIGSGLSPEILRTLGFKTLLQSIILWILIGSLSLIVIKYSVL